MFKQNRSVCQLVLALTMVLVSFPAFAEEPAKKPALEEIVVTAEKREASLQKTPIAIAAFDARALDEMGITDVTDLRGSVPNFFTSHFAADRVAPLLFIRGMGSVDVQTTKDAAVASYLDGVPLGRASGMGADIADLERIEVLRGPQGTLYGRNTTGGAINFISQKPHDKLAFKEKLTGGNLGYWSTTTNANVPITDQLFTNFAYVRSKTDGWVRNNSNLGNQIDPFKDDRQAGRFAVRYMPADNLTIDYAYDFSVVTYGNAFYQIKTKQKDERQRSANPVLGLEPSKSNIDGQSLTISWDLGDVTLNSISGYRTLKNELFQSYIDVGLPLGFAQQNSVSQNQFSQEFQAVGQAWDQVEYVAGLFYYRERSTENQSTDFHGAFDVWRVKAKSESMAIYGQGTWTPPRLDERMHITVGLRYTDDDRRAAKEYVNDLSTISPPGTILNGKKDFGKLTWALTIAYDWTDDLNTYVKAVTGYRAGGFNTRSTATGFSDGFNEEDVRSFEAGLKSSWFDNRARLNVSAFYNQYMDLQVDQVRSPAIFTDTLNAGRATMWGGEVETTVLITEGLTASMFYTHLDAQYDKYLDNGVDLSNVKKIPYSPKDAAKASVRYEFSPCSFGQFIVNADYQWQAKTFSGPNPDTDNKSFGIYNASVQLADIPLPEGKLRVALWGKNLEDLEYTVATTNLGAIAGIYGTPRTYGLDVVFEY